MQTGFDAPSLSRFVTSTTGLLPQYLMLNYKTHYFHKTINFKENLYDMYGMKQIPNIASDEVDMFLSQGMVAATVIHFKEWS